MAEIKSSNPINEQSGNHVRTRSKFDLSYHFFDTHRFGDITPHVVMDSVPADKDVLIGSSHDLSTYSFKAPLMQKLSMKKDYFQVPLQALLPLNYEKFITNPVIGDDVDAENVGLTLTPNSHRVPGTDSRDLILRYRSSLQQLISSLEGVFDTQSSNFNQNQKNIVFFQVIMTALLSMEKFFSNGCLLAKLGCHLSSLGKFTDYDSQGQANYVSFDQLFDSYISKLIEDIMYLEYKDYDGRLIRVITDPSRVLVPALRENYLTFREYLEVLRDDPWLLCHIVNCYMQAGRSFNYGDNRYFELAGYGLLADLSYAPGFKLNLARPLAYQMVCAHFYTNDKIDYIYNAELYRQYVNELVSGVPEYGDSIYDSFTTVPSLLPGGQFFEYNGVKYNYDYLSAFNLNQIFPAFNPNVSQFVYDPVTQGVFLPNGRDLDVNFQVSIYPVLNMLRVLVLQTAVLGYRHSLRYVDYFVGAKSRPLAVGDVNVDVNQNSQFSVIDVTRNIQMQRFLNAVNRSGRRLSEYVKSLFGVEQAQDYHEPLYLGHTSDDVVGTSIENTADAQQTEALSVTSVLRSNASKYVFTGNFDRFSVIIGVTYYDIPRSYYNTVERPFAHVDRFDMFNPDLQFIGDQAIYQSEVNPAVASDVEKPFGYTIRNMEYKQRYNQAAGGFVEALPGYAFLADYDDSRRYLSLERHIGPSFIRSKNYELDRFFISLTGYSLGTYFHFILDNYNQISASRPMAWQPGILNS